MSDPFGLPPGAPEEPNLELLHSWAELIPLMQSNPVEAARLLDDRDRQLADWNNRHAHPTAEASGGLNVSRAWSFGQTIPAGASTEIAWDNGPSDIAGETIVGASPFPGEEGISLGWNQTRRWGGIIHVQVGLEDSVSDGYRHLVAEWVDTAWAFAFPVNRLPIATTPSTDAAESGLSGSFGWLHPNPALMRFVVEHDNGGSTSQDVLDGSSVTFLELYNLPIDE